ncbi:MAG: FAD-dependent monooxygenase [Cryobacterium sp.]|nr:FAD-dependent monooxygenase [Cryobacterium sp.]
MRIGIIGAGIGGLVAALALQRDGHGVTVFERQQRPGAIGAGLSLFGNAFTALDAVGVGELVAPLTSKDVAMLAAGQRRPSGRWLVRMPPDASASLRVLHRADLHDALSSALRSGTLRPASEATVATDGSPTLMAAGSSESFDLVIAADGIRSDARRSLGLDPGVRYAGYTAWRGVTRTAVNVHGEAGETWGRGRRFGVAPLPDGRVYWFATQTLPPGTEFEDERQAILDRFGDWHDPIGELVEATDPSAVLRHDIHELARPLASFVRGRTILLGDAAHAMTPDLGQGAGQAIEDAASIALLLRRHKVDDAVRIYDRVRRPRSQAIARRSRTAGRIAQFSAPLAAHLRDTALTLAPARIVGSAVHRVQTWTPPQ